MICVWVITGIVRPHKLVINELPSHSHIIPGYYSWDGSNGYIALSTNIYGEIFAYGKKNNELDDLFRYNFGSADLNNYEHNFTAWILGAYDGITKKTGNDVQHSHDFFM